jgi:LacI family transcriptional regulator
MVRASCGRVRGSCVVAVKRKSNIKSVAEVAGVSSMTVSRYFNQPHKLSSETLGRVEAAIKTLNYIPNNAARTLLHGNSETLAFIGHFGHPFDYTIMRGVEDYVYQQNYLLFLCNLDNEHTQESHFISGLLRRRVDGIVFFPRYSKDNLLLLVEHHVPTVVVDQKIDDVPFDSVRGDSFEAGYDLTKALIAKGYKRIAFIGGPKGMSSLEARLNGYKKAMKEVKYKPDIHLGDYSRESGFEIITNLFADGHKQFDALIGANDSVTLGMLEALKKLGLKPHDDVALASFDGIDDYFQFEHPLIANIVQPAYEIGHCAAQMLIERIQGFDGPPREKILPFKLMTF